jgi:nucleoside-diphosphate-sugar epimerase
MCRPGANLLAMESDEADYGVFNVGTGRALTILDVANALIAHFEGRNGNPKLVLSPVEASEIGNLQSETGPSELEIEPPNRV